MKQLYFAALALFTIAPTQAATSYTILDEFTDGGVPLGTSYAPLTFYDRYVDAGSVDHSPFVIEKTTNYTGGILFFGNMELTSEGDANTFRLAATNGGFFNFNSFDCNLEANTWKQSDFGNPFDFGNQFVTPTLTITSDTGERYDFLEEQSSANPNWTDVRWVDFTSQYTKAHVSNLSLTITAVPEVNSSFAILGLISSGLMLRRRTKHLR